MCGGAVGGIIDDVGDATGIGASDIINPGGIIKDPIGIGKDIYDEGSDALADLDDSLRNEEGQQAAEEAAKAAESAQMAGIDLQKAWQEYIKGVQQPYVDAGASFLPQLIDFLSPENQDAYRQQALESEGYKAISGAASRGLIAQGAALGNRLSSGLQEEVLGQQGLLAQQYGENAVQQRLQQLTAGAGLGLNALGVTAPQIGASNAAIQQGYGNIGNIQTGLAQYKGQYSGLNPYLPLISGGLQAYAAYSGGQAV